MRRPKVLILSTGALVLAVSAPYFIPKLPDEAQIVRNLATELALVAQASRNGATERVFSSPSDAQAVAKRFEAFLQTRPGWIVDSSSALEDGPGIIATFSPLMAPRWWSSIPLLDRLSIPDHRAPLMVSVMDGCFAKDDQPFDRKGRWTTLSIRMLRGERSADEPPLLEGWVVRRPSPQ